MPEGDTVWRAARPRGAARGGHELTRSGQRRPPAAPIDQSGHVVDEVLSRGKHLLIRVGDASIHSHLKMEGLWHVYRHGARWGRPAHMARAVLETSERQAVGFSLGILEVLQRDKDDEALAYLGPDLLGPDWDLEEAVRRVSADPDRPIYLALLDQRNLAGLGNEYVTELLFVSGLHPARPVGEVPDVARVVARGQKMLDVNKDRLQRTFTGDTRPGRERWMYGRERARCRRCDGPIRSGDLGDRPTAERTTMWCPHCQR